MRRRGREGAPGREGGTQRGDLAWLGEWLSSRMRAWRPVQRCWDGGEGAPRSDPGRQGQGGTGRQGQRGGRAPHGRQGTRRQTGAGGQAGRGMEVAARPARWLAGWQTRGAEPGGAGGGCARGWGHGQGTGAVASNSLQQKGWCGAARAWQLCRPHTPGRAPPTIDTQMDHQSNPPAARLARHNPPYSIWSAKQYNASTAAHISCSHARSSCTNMGQPGSSISTW